MSKQPHRKCIFCGRAGVTREHVVPRWVLAELTSAGVAAPYRHTSGSDGGTTRSWLSSGVDFTVKRICKSCNSGWMNADLEVPAKRWLGRLFRTEPCDLGADARRDVAAWAYKTSAMAQLRTAGPSATSAAHLDGLYQSRRAPAEAVVFLGCFAGSTDVLIDGFSQRFGLAPVPGAGTPGFQEEFAGEIFKLRLGPLLIMCITGSAGRSFVKPQALEPGFDDRLIAIWPGPLSSDPRWPPPEPVRSDDVWKSLTHVVTNVARPEVVREPTKPAT